MAKSKARRKRSRHRSAAPATPADSTAKRRREALKQRVGWPMVVIGVFLFLAGQAGSQVGFTLLPFDEHHVIEQIGGFLLAITGLVWAWR